jgi:hypothetical protein
MAMETKPTVVLVVTRISHHDRGTQILGVFLDDTVAKNYCQELETTDIILSWSEVSHKQYFRYTAQGVWCRYNIDVWSVTE